MLLDPVVFVFVGQPFVVTLPGDRPGFPGGGIMESEHFNRSGPNRLSHGHPSRPVCADQQLDLAPCVRIKFAMRHFLEKFLAGVVASWPVIPMPAIGWLKLNATER